MKAAFTLGYAIKLITAGAVSIPHSFNIVLPSFPFLRFRLNVPPLVMSGVTNFIITLLPTPLLQLGIYADAMGGELGPVMEKSLPLAATVLQSIGALKSSTMESGAQRAALTLFINAGEEGRTVILFAEVVS